MPSNVTSQQVTLSLPLPSGYHADIMLDCRRAVYLADLQILLVADLHWGKGETFRKYGIPIPHSVLHADLARLSDLLAFYQPERLFVLGDLIHGREGLTPDLTETIVSWREHHRLPICLMEGNHDKAIDRVADAWSITVVPEYWQEGGFLFSHAPMQQEGYFNWCGHIHPTIRLSSPTDQLRLPCFQLTETQGLLPAFSLFTGGFNIQPQPSDQVFVVGEDFVVPV